MVYTHLCKKNIFTHNITSFVLEFNCNFLYFDNNGFSQSLLAAVQITGKYNPRLYQLDLKNRPDMITALGLCNYAS